MKNIWNSCKALVKGAVDFCREKVAEVLAPPVRHCLASKAFTVALGFLLLGGGTAMATAPSPPDYSFISYEDGVLDFTPGNLVSPIMGGWMKVTAAIGILIVAGIIINLIIRKIRGATR